MLQEDIMFWNLLRMESDKVFRRRLLWIGLVIAILPMVIAFFAFFHLSQSASLAKYWIWPGGLTSALAFADGFSPGYGYSAYLLAVVVGVVTAQEYSWRTMQLWLSHGIPRPLLLLAKFTLSLVTVLLVVLAFLLVGGVTSMIFAYQLHGSIDSSHFDIVQLFLSYLRTCYGILPYVGLTFLLVVVSAYLTAVPFIRLRAGHARHAGRQRQQHETETERVFHKLTSPSRPSLESAR